MSIVGRPAWPQSLLVVTFLLSCAPHPTAPPAGAPKIPTAAASTRRATAVGDFIVDENFNAIAEGHAPEGFVVTPLGAASVQNVPFAGNRSLRLTRSQTAPAVSISTAFAATSGKVVVEAKLKALELAGSKSGPELLSPDGRAVLGMVFEDGALRVANGSQRETLQPFTADTWYILRLVLDTQRQSFDLYVDGVQLRTNAPLREHAATVSGVALRIADSAPGTLFVDNLRVYELGQFIGAPRGPVFDGKTYGAKGDGTSKDTAAIQAAIDAVPVSGGTVYLHDGKFISGTLTLKSNLTVYLASTAILKASSDITDFPTQAPNTHNTTLDSCARSLFFVQEAHDITLDGGGVIDGDGSLPQYKVDDHGTERDRAIMFWAVHVQNLKLQNVYFRDGATWGIVPMECDRVELRNVYIHTPYPANRDGIDIVDSDHVEIRDSTFNTEDDAICPKSGIRKGLNDLHVANVNITNVTHANAIKLGTADYGGLKHALFEDILIKNPAKSALALEATDGGDVTDVTFRRIEIDGSGNPFFLLIEDRKRTPSNDIPKIGSIDGVHYEDITAKNSRFPFGSLFLGFTEAGVTYPLRNLSFDNVHVSAPGGASTTPAAPPEPTTGYPETDMFGALPAWGYYFRHVQGLRFSHSSLTATAPDTREKAALIDVQNLTGAP